MTTLPEEPDDVIVPAEEESVLTRHVPRNSGEAAIYSPGYLTRREGNRYGADPAGWRGNV